MIHNGIFRVTGTRIRKNHGFTLMCVIFSASRSFFSRFSANVGEF
ncbi:hypothetical protein ESA_02564 [Cronobacter sakazakii ATCC BAA-894]|uniref:Uncharacterized protein n=1 Tax=Cronobacter sakazakii (strain ATCC BAA-894) TaxID=290339 RepID=A7MJ11_CROS8|nr:hypothetical protein ESA_02564 [Cronobacter sakazakii ATCC BAA-894]